jgi:hypothetical protein
LFFANIGTVVRVLVGNKGATSEDGGCAYRQDDFNQAKAALAEGPP